MFIEGMALLLLGWMPYAWDLSADLASRYGIVSAGTSDIMREIYITCVFVGLLTIHDTIVSLPFSLYSTFVVEEKHGFNKTVLYVSFLCIYNHPNSQQSPSIHYLDYRPLLSRQGDIFGSHHGPGLSYSCSCGQGGATRRPPLLLLCVGVPLCHVDRPHDYLPYLDRPSIQQVYPASGGRALR